MRSPLGPHDETRSNEKPEATRPLLRFAEKGSWQRRARGIFTFPVQVFEGLVSGKLGKASVIYSDMLFMPLARLKRELLLPDIWCALPSGKSLFIKFYLISNGFSVVLSL